MPRAGGGSVPVPTGSRDRSRRGASVEPERVGVASVLVRADPAAWRSLAVHTGPCAVGLPTLGRAPDREGAREPDTGEDPLMWTYLGRERAVDPRPESTDTASAHDPTEAASDPAMTETRLPSFRSPPGGEAFTAPSTTRDNTLPSSMFAMLLDATTVHIRMEWRTHGHIN